MATAWEQALGLQWKPAVYVLIPPPPAMADGQGPLVPVPRRYHSFLLQHSPAGYPVPPGLREEVGGLTIWSARSSTVLRLNLREQKLKRSSRLGPSSSMTITL